MKWSKHSTQEKIPLLFVRWIIDPTQSDRSRSILMVDCCVIHFSPSFMSEGGVFVHLPPGIGMDDFMHKKMQFRAKIAPSPGDCGKTPSPIDISKRWAGAWRWSPLIWWPTNTLIHENHAFDEPSSTDSWALLAVFLTTRAAPMPPVPRIESMTMVGRVGWHSWNVGD